jgi:hypothetical protein
MIGMLFTRECEQGETNISFEGKERYVIKQEEEDSLDGRIVETLFEKTSSQRLREEEGG